MKRRNNALEWWTCGDIPVVTDQTKQAAKHALLLIEDWLKPADINFVKQSVYTLMQHYYKHAGLTEVAQQLIATDWLEDLREFPDWAIHQACKQWRQNNVHKPTPGHIVKLCRIAISKEQAMLIQCKKIIKEPINPPKKEISEEQRLKNIEEINKLIAKAKKTIKGEIWEYPPVKNKTSNNI